MDVAVRRIGDGELVGEHRRYNDGLATFILRLRYPQRHGAHLERNLSNPEHAPHKLGEALREVEQDARERAAGHDDLAWDGAAGEAPAPHAASTSSTSATPLNRAERRLAAAIRRRKPS